jgi:outer membrane receptor protein involved in Fe transport
MTGGVITGIVVDGIVEAPLEYANIILFDKRSGDQVTGTITHKDGHFELKSIRPGVFDLEIKFMGYEIEKIEGIRVIPPEMSVDLGTIALRRSVIALEEVEVSAEKPELVYKIDKKVINVSKQLTSTSGTAVDVLENVPSVTVDIEGNVSLRGSSSFTVLLDGRPTVLDPNEVLQQIPASTIDNIEIITNPSAKYDPDGIAGIINIITKKSRLAGVSGTINANTGLDYKYGGDVLLSYRGQKINAHLGLDYNRREHPGTYDSESRTRRDTLTSFVVSSGSSRWERSMYSGKAGLDINLTDIDVVGFEARAGARSMERRSDQDFDEWTSLSEDRNQYVSKSEMERSGDFYSASMDYQHRFSKQEHELSGQVVFSRYSGDAEDVTELFDENGEITSGQRSVEDGPSTRLRAKLDYVLPLQEGSKFEAGYQNRFDRTEDGSEAYEYDPNTGRYEFQPEFSHTSEYDREIHSIYTIYSREDGRFGYQGGIRSEYTDRRMSLKETDETYTIERWDFFPTLHVSYEYSEGTQMMASYTRRIDRPRNWYLEPFLTWSDAYNVRQGNPSLKPEYIDSYELGAQKRFGTSTLALEAYYRVTHNKIERVQSVYEDNVILHTTGNVGKDYTFGTEIILNMNMVRWWNLSVMGNLYDYRVEGTLDEKEFSEQSFNWRLRLNNTFRVARSTRIQINGNYNSPTASAQGKREGFIFTDLALRQEFLNRALAATLQVRDVFSTGKFEFTSEGEDFYSHREFSRKSPSVTLSLSYNFNNYKPEREEPEEREVFEGDEDF